MFLDFLFLFLKISIPQLTVQVCQSLSISPHFSTVYLQTGLKYGSTLISSNVVFYSYHRKKNSLQFILWNILKKILRLTTSLEKGYRVGLLIPLCNKDTSTKLVINMLTATK